MKYIVKDHTQEKEFEFSWFKEAQEFFYEYRQENSFSHITLSKQGWESNTESNIIATYYPD
ncbi:MAG TPA: hypothetical protein DEG69_09995 [Flavobacteriaceae bacterium]|nr:hypothetical protein [Flavobacteriaceae bacterium]